jgi:2-polyprenyl-3-methyl-5-hydroxy-6-metoxy-1,4-benzoquinol methylase
LASQIFARRPGSAVQIRLTFGSSGLVAFGLASGMGLTHPHSGGFSMNTELIEQNVHRLLGAMTGAATTAMVAVGDQLGLYRALADGGPATQDELADRTGTAARYLREWLSQQAAAGFLAYREGDGRYVLPAEAAAVLADEASPAFLAGGATITRGWFAGIDRLAGAFKTGAGIPWDEQDPAVFEGTERFFRPGYTASLTTEWVPALPGVTDRLAAGGRVADVGCGHGVAAILLARAFPQASVHGYDFHDRSIQVARQQADQAGLGGRIRFETLDATSYPADGFDLICFLDTLHDLGDPAAALAHARKALAPDGAVLVVEPNAADDYAANLANPLAALNYAASTFQCTPAALAQPGGIALGAQAGPAAVRQLADDAGFSRFRQVTQTPVNVVLELRP